MLESSTSEGSLGCMPRETRSFLEAVGREACQDLGQDAIFETVIAELTETFQ
jgi:hypothetical protein